MNKSLNVVLIGMRGSGKSTVAKILSRRMHRDWMDLDVVVTARVHLQIPEIVEQHGWDYFRDQEADAVRVLTQLRKIIIATGGGVILRDSNMQSLQENGCIVYLKTPANVLLKRIRDDPNRPALIQGLTREEEIIETLRQRETLYEHWARYTVDTELLSPKQVAEQTLIQIGGDL